MGSVWVGLVSILSKVFSWLPALLAYLAGRRSRDKEIELATAKKEKEYLEIELKPRDDTQRMKDGTW